MTLMNQEFYDELRKAGAHDTALGAARIPPGQRSETRKLLQRGLATTSDRPDLRKLEALLEQIVEELQEIRAALGRIEQRP
jgi:hypothetical protein